VPAGSLRKATRATASPQGGDNQGSIDDLKIIE